MWSAANSSLAGASGAVAVLTSVLAWYSWARRREPGARSLAIASALATIWALASLMQALSAEPDAQILWYGVSTALLLPMLCAVTGFVQQYAGLGRYLTPTRVWWVLVVPAVADFVLVVSNPVHGLVWTDAVVDASGAVRLDVNALGWVGLGYYTALGLLNLSVLLRLILISPSRRRPAGLMFVAHLVSRYAYAHEVFGWDLPLPVSPAVLTVGIPFATYAVALFGLHVFDPVPAARRAALEHMSDGVVVADADGAVIEANPAAVRILGRSIAELRGRQLGDLLPPRASVRAELGESNRFEIDLRAGDATRHYVVDRSGLTDEMGRAVGHLFLLHDLTEQIETQGRLVENRQAVARLTEREHLARDLHDSVGQVLGFVSMQAQAVQKRLADGDAERADAMLARLAEVAQQAHGDVRGLILALKSPVSADGAWSLDANLADQLRDFQSSHGIATALLIGDGMGDERFDTATGVQVLRVVQEALTNARRHGGAASVRVVVERSGERIRITVEDDGDGFDRDALEIDAARQFGLAIMRERMEEIGGSLKVESSPGRGTRVTLEVPVTGREGVA